MACSVRFLVGCFGEFVDQVLEQVAHLSVGHPVRVQVDFGELRRHQVEPVLFIQSCQLVLELEPLEDVDVCREPGDVVHQVGPQSLGIFQQTGEVEGAGVVEPEPGIAFHLDIERSAGVLGGQRAHVVASGFQDAVQAPQNRKRQDHAAVLVRLVYAAQLVSDAPHEIAQLAQTGSPSGGPTSNRGARTLTTVSRAFGGIWARIHLASVRIMPVRRGVSVCRHARSPGGQPKAVSRISCCSTACTFDEPDDGADIARRETRLMPVSKSGSTSGRVKPNDGHAP